MARLILLNKPFNILSQFTTDSDKRTLAAFITEKGLYPAGRLDYDSEGLLLLTDNGQLQHHIAHPKHKKPKTYWAQVENIPNPQALEQLRQGVELKDGKTLPAKAKLIDDSDPRLLELWPRNPPIRERQSIPTAWIELTITEGKNRQVRRMTAAVGHPTLRLVRKCIGDWSVKGLAPGEFKELEVEAPKAAPKENRSQARKPSKSHTGSRRPHNTPKSGASKSNTSKSNTKSRKPRSRR